MHSAASMPEGDGAKKHAAGYYLDLMFKINAWSFDSDERLFPEMGGAYS
jgi:hypothetical protein